jgi:hypothetical protein
MASPGSPEIRLTSSRSYDGSTTWSANVPELRDKDGYHIIGGTGSDPAAALFACLEDAARLLIYWNKERQNNV